MPGWTCKKAQKQGRDKNTRRLTLLRRTRWKKTRLLSICCMPHFIPLTSCFLTYMYIHHYMKSIFFHLLYCSAEHVEPYIHLVGKVPYTYNISQKLPQFEKFPLLKIFVLIKDYENETHEIFSTYVLCNWTRVNYCRAQKFFNTNILLTNIFNTKIFQTMV